MLKKKKMAQSVKVKKKKKTQNTSETLHPEALSLPWLSQNTRGSLRRIMFVNA